MADSRFEIRKLHRSGDSQQVTVPKAYMGILGWESGEKIYVYMVGNVLCMRRFDEGGFRPEVVPVVPRRAAEMQRES